MQLIEIIKIIIIGIIEGITEWLPISSTGHMILADEFLKLDMSAEFKEMFLILIQLGAILAVVVLFWKKMWPFHLSQIKKREGPVIRKDIFSIWFKVIVACIPGVIAAFTIDDFVNEYLHTPVVIALALIIYGILFIVIENRNKLTQPRVKTLSEITYKTAFIIGLFQILAIIPGTSRSGATIIGALIIGVSRVASAEFTFFLAVPVMFGDSLLKLLKFGLNFTAVEAATLALGMVVAFAVSMFAVKFLMSYIKKHDFKAFGIYRIALGIIVLLYFGIKAIVIA